MSYSYCNWYGQEGFTWQKIWRISINYSLEWIFSELFFSNVSLWNQYKYISFDIFSCRILIISYKMSIITRISNETRNEITIYAKSCRSVTVFYRKELASLFQVQEKLKTCKDSKWNFLSSCLQITVMQKWYHYM